jgi:hypothetical protein
MVADSQIPLTASLLMLGLFCIAIIGFTIGFATDTGADVSVLDDPENTFGNFYTQGKGNISSFRTGSESTYESILETTVEPGSDVAQSNAPFAITPANVIGVTYNVVELPNKVIFGGLGSQFGFIIAGFIGFLVFVFGLVLYKSLRGSP